MAIEGGEIGAAGIEAGEAGAAGIEAGDFGAAAIIVNGIGEEFFRMLFGSDKWERGIRMFGRGTGRAAAIDCGDESSAELGRPLESIDSLMNTKEL